MRQKLAKVEGVFFGKEGHGILTMNIGLDYGDGGHQSFGGISLGGKSGIDYIEKILSLFRINELDEMVGRTVYALFDSEGINATIKGLEMPSFDGGGKFVTKEWQAEMGVK